MKRYLLFAYYHYYPSGGLSDLQGDFESLDEGLTYLLKEKVEEIYDVWYIYDQVEDKEITGSG